MILKPKQIIERKNFLKTQRVQWENHWQELGEFIQPNKAVITVKRTTGDKMNTHLYDNTAIQSNELLAGALHGLLTNPYTQWFELTTGVPALDSKDNVRKWLQDTARKMHNVLNDSNFQTEIHEYYLDLGCFGTGPLLMEEDEKSIVRFMAIFIGNIYVAENDKGVIDEVQREIHWPARLIIDHFGKDVIKSRKVQEAYAANSDDKFCIIHHVYPNRGDRSGKLSNFDFISHYILVEDESDITVKGFDEMPFIIGRWSKTTDETYGRGPGMTALPEAKTINKMTEMTLLAAAKIIDPPIALPDNGYVLPLQTGPSGVNYYRAGTQDEVKQIFNRDIRIDFGEALMEKHRQRIREAFFVDQLQLNVGPQMTATEVNQRTDEKMRLLGPMLGRQDNELLSPMITRLYKIMSKRGLLDSPPSEVKSFGVKYSSTIARVQRQAEGDNILKTLNVVAPLINLDPSCRHNIDCDQAVKMIAKIYGAPQEVLRDQDEVDKLKKAESDAQAAQLKNQQELADAEKVNKVAPAIPQQSQG